MLPLYLTPNASENTRVVWGSSCPSWRRDLVSTSPISYGKPTYPSHFYPKYSSALSALAPSGAWFFSGYYENYTHQDPGFSSKGKWFEAFEVKLFKFETSFLLFIYFFFSAIKISFCIRLFIKSSIFSYVICNYNLLFFKNRLWIRIINKFRTIR